MYHWQLKMKRYQFRSNKEWKHHNIQLESAGALNMYLFRISRSKPISEQSTSKDRSFPTQMNSRGLCVRKIAKNNGKKDSCGDHFILQSIKFAEHEIMQILLSGWVGIDLTYLGGFASVCNSVCLHAVKHKTWKGESVFVAVFLSVWAHLRMWPLIKRRAPSLPVRRVANWSETAVIGIRIRPAALIPSRFSAPGFCESGFAWGQPTQLF